MRTELKLNSNCAIKEDNKEKAQDKQVMIHNTIGDYLLTYPTWVMDPCLLASFPQFMYWA